MLSLGSSLAFAQPLFLIGLLALPALWWLLRATPPAARRVSFPAVRVLLGLEDKERTPRRTPWWLLLLRLLAAAFLLFAFSQPLLNPQARLGGEGPVLIVFDGGWGSAPDWEERRAFARDLLRQADDAERLAAVVALAEAPPAEGRIPFAPAAETLEVLEILEPRPWRADAEAWAELFDAGALAEFEAAGGETVWLHDGLDHAGADALADQLAGVGPLRLIGPERVAAAIRPPELREGRLVVEALRSEPGPERTVRVAAYGAPPPTVALEPEAELDAEVEAEVAFGTERRLTVVEATFGEGDLTAEAAFDLPLELRNTLSRLELQGDRHAGAIALMDARWRRRTIALVAGETGERRLPLLSGAHYLRSALAPHASFRETTLREAIGLPELSEFDAARLGAERAAPDDEARAWADAIILSDIGRIDFETEAALIEWVEDGGLLIRFAGPKLAAFASELSRVGGGPRSEHPLLPTRLRGGGRALGGALSWSTPQGLAPFPETSPFVGLDISEEVTVSRQVLAEPGPELSDRVWASLADGTPLVTAKELGGGQVVLFHVAASAGWSSLPLSGLFVEMVGRLAAAAPALAAEEAALATADRLWTPERILTGFGALEVPEEAAPVDGAALAEGARVGVAPGVYVALSATGEESRLALSALGRSETLAPRPPAPRGATVETLAGGEETDLKPPFLAIALSLLTIDILAALFVAGRLRSGVAAALGLAVGLSAIGGFAPHAAAQSTAEPPAPRAEIDRIIDPAERRAALETVMAYVVTGDREIDAISAAGMLGLSATLFQRTAIEPGEGAGVDLETDEIAVYAVLYWPITARQPALSARAVRKLNAFMRTGGLLVVDTRDAHQTFGAAQGPNTHHLRRLLAGLDLPPMEPIPVNHVLTRSFYLLDELPGRWRGGQVWVEAGSQGEADGQTFINENDGVSPIVIGAADWAAAWAIDDNGRPLRPIGSGGENQRETAYRFGVNLAMYAFTGNYKSDQVHLPSLLERLGN